jgi:PilZ domain-containing protein
MEPAMNMRPSAIPRDRRTGMRRTTRVKVQARLTRATGDGPWFASVRNLSTGGVGLIADRQFKPNMLLTIELPTGRQHYAAPRLFKITHATPQPGGKWWVLGGVFASPLTSEELEALL